MTFIRKNKDIILDSIQLLLFFIIGFKVANKEIIFSSILTVFVVGRVIFEYKIKNLFELIKTNIIDYIFFAILILSLFAFKSGFDGASSIIKNGFHYIVLPIGFWLASFTTTSKIGWKGLSNLIAFFAGCLLFALFGGGKYYSEFGFNSSIRVFTDIWSSNYMTCTVVSLYLVPATICLIALAVYLVFNKKFLISIVLIIIAILPVILSASLSNRGFFVSSLFALFALVFFFYFQEIGGDKKITIFLYILVGITSAVLIFTVFVSFNVFNLKTELMKFPLFERILSGGTDKARSAIYAEFFSKFWRYPFGGLRQSGELVVGEYIHNMLLDMYCYAGIVPFICFLYFVLKLFVVQIRDKIYRDEPYLFLIYSSFFLGIFAISFFEPTFESNAYYFAAYFMIFSMLSRDSKGKKIFVFKKKDNQVEKIGSE